MPPCKQPGLFKIMISLENNGIDGLMIVIIVSFPLHARMTDLSGIIH